MDPVEVKQRSERIIHSLGGQTLDWLPLLEPTVLRSSAEVADRALVMHALIQIFFEAPTPVIATWITKNHLDHALSRFDRQILQASYGAIRQQDHINLYWYVEALWALAWAGNLIPDLAIQHPVGDNLAQLMPDIQTNEDARDFRDRFQLRPVPDIYAMLDLYYRAHWYAREGSLKGYSTGRFNLDIVMERRKALEWISDPSIDDWDDTELST